MPSESSCVLSRRQYPHQVVEYIVTVPASGRVCVVIGPRSLGGQLPQVQRTAAGFDSRRGSSTSRADVSVGAARLGAMSADALLDALDPEQRAVATTLRGPVRVL